MSSSKNFRVYCRLLKARDNTFCRGRAHVYHVLSPRHLVYSRGEKALGIPGVRHLKFVVLGRKHLKQWEALWGCSCVRTFISVCLGLKSFLLYKVMYGIRSQKFIWALCHAIGRYWSAKIDDISLGPPVSIGSQKPSWHLYFRYEYCTINLLHILR
jgi:hypothetical protein